MKTVPVWREATMKEALLWASGKAIVGSERGRPFADDCEEWDCVKLSDGSIIACKSRWSGPYSEVTPAVWRNVDAEPPVWRIGLPSY